MYKAYLLTSSTPEMRIVRLLKYKQELLKKTHKKGAITFSPWKDTTSHTHRKRWYIVVTLRHFLSSCGVSH